MQKELKNEKLELAISVFASERNKENLEKVMEEMKNAFLYVPSMISDDMKKQIEMIKRGEKPGPQTKVSISPIFIKNQNGISYLPVYTSRDHVPQEQKYPMMFTLPFAECNRLAIKAKDKVSGIVINPFTNNLVLNVNVAPKNSPSATPANTPRSTVSAEQKEVLLRKAVELGMIPQRLFQEKGKFVEELSEQKEEGLAKMFQAMYGANAVSPYEVGDFNMIVMDVSDNLRLMDIEMPDKNRTEGCAKSIYIGWNPKTDAVKYYIITQSSKEKPSTLVELLEGGKVNQLGEAPASGGEVFHMLELCKDL